MKKGLASILAFVLMAVMILTYIPALAEEYTINLDIDFDENLAFSRYDVDMKLDTEFIASLSHGVSGKKTFSASEGDHTIWFYKHGDSSVSGSAKININGNLNVSCKIHCNSTQVTVSNVRIVSDNAAASAPTRSMPAEEEPKTEEPAVQKEEEPTAEVKEEAQPQNVNSGNGVWINFDTATDEELEEALQKIKAEQRARIKTKIVLDKTSLTLKKGETGKISVTIEGLPEGVKAGKITAATSDKAVAIVNNGAVKATGNGSAVITFSCVLSDGTEVSAECPVEVIVPIKSIVPVKKGIELGANEQAQAEFKINPADATKTALSYSSSDSSVAAVNSDGVIHAKGIGTATITAAAADGSNASASMTVKVSKKDDRGKTFTNKEGISLTVLSVKQTDGSGYSKADVGNTFVLVELQIENNSSKDMTVNSTFGFDAICDDYTIDYSFAADLNTKNGFSTADIKPGRKVKGWKGFEVPKKWKELYIKFTPNISLIGGDDPIEFVIYNQ